MRISYIIVPLLIAGAAYAWYWRDTHPPVVEVEVISVERGTVESTVANTRAGTVKACRRAMLSPYTGGKISSLPFKEGDYVKQGDILLQVWNRDLLAETTHIKKTIQSSKNTAHAVCLQAQASKRSADRHRRLYAAKTISQEIYENAMSEANIQQANCAAAKANIAVADASLKVIEEQLKRSIVSAPFNGVIAKINGELNEYVTPSPPGISTQPVIDLIEPGCFKVVVPVDEVDAPKVKQGMLAKISLDAWRGRVFEATVSRIGVYIIDREKQARTIDIELQFVNPADFSALLVGYSADADIVLETHKDVLRIPTEALLDENHVLIFNSQTQLLEKQSIKQGLGNWSFTEITEGLKESDKLVISLGLEGVKEGVLAKIKSEEDKPEATKND